MEFEALWRGTSFADCCARNVSTIDGRSAAATAPFRCAMATKAGCECISHVLQALTELNPNATILSVDGMSAFDMMSRKVAGIEQRLKEVVLHCRL